MIKYLFKPLVLLVAISLCITKSHSQSLPISSYGVWDRGGQITDFSDPNVDFVKGIEATAAWEDIELVKGTFDFSSFQQELDKAYANNKLIRFSVEVGPDSPLWMYDNDTNPSNNPYPQVQQVTTSGGNDKPSWPIYPEYLSQTYQNYLGIFLNQFSNFLRSQPAEKFAKIAFVQVKTGCTGDEVPYKGSVDNPIYEISDAQWADHRILVFQKYKEFFNDVPDKKIVLSFNDIDPSDPNELYAWNWVTNPANIDPAIGFGIKGGAFNRGHHLSGEQSYKNSLYNYLVNPILPIKTFSASEMDGTTQDLYFQICEDMSYYWAALGGINVGLSTNNLNAVAMDYAVNNPSGRETFRMFTRYAQQVFPGTATTAFSVFHEGLNAADKVKFPELIYGDARMDNQDRYQAICDDPKYYNRGARMGDKLAATKGQVYQRASQTALNDAGWEIAEGNIERFMTQIDPDATSIGLFRLRAPITSTSSKYDRFARSFENSTGRNTMYFQLHNELPANNKNLKFTIIWLDKNAGSTWAFKYRNSSGLQTIPFAGTGTNQWRTETFNITDGVMNQGGVNGSDFMLVNTDTLDDIFNGIEMNILQTQTINFNALPSKKVGDIDFSPGATSSSGLAVTYTSSNTNVATIVGDKIHIVGSGACTITASQAGDNYYYPASSVSQYLSVVVETQTTITTTGTWTCPAGINTIKVEAWGGGGSGGGAYAQGFGGGGAGGSYVINNNVAVAAGSYAVTVGAGGAASGTGGANGNPGGTTTFGSTIPVIANGGALGGGTGSSTAQLGSGGTNSSGGSGGTITLGLAGASGASGSGGAGGAGAEALGGAGGVSKTSAGAGIAGTAPGGGGGGAYGPGSPATSGSNRGGAGGAGQIIVTYRVGVSDAPIIGTATVLVNSGVASIPFTAPAFNGNATITSYTAISSPGGFTGTLNQAGSGVITVNGLSNATTYTFTVKAINSVGESVASVASNAVTPNYRISQTITFGALSAVNYGDTVLPGATASSGLPVTYSSSNPLVATTSGSTITIVGTGLATITATQGGNDTYSPATSISQTLVVNKKTLSITTASIASKVYNSLPASGLITMGTLSGFVGSETVTATATGLYADANVGTAKLATTTYTLADGTNGGKAANYSLANGTAEGTITQAPLTITGVIANNKTQDGNTIATLSALGSLSGVFAADTENVTLNSSSVSANFDTAASGTGKPITISGYTISGSASANYSLSQPTGITANIAPLATITAEGATTFCSGGSVTLSANIGSGLTYLWSTGATTQSIAVTTSGSYTVTVTDIGGSTISAATTVTVNPITTHTTIVSANKSYIWIVGNGNTYTASGNYTHVVGCHTETLALTITNTSEIPTGPLSLCKGATVASVTGTTSLKFYATLTGGTALSGATALATRTLFVTEKLGNGSESTPRVSRNIVVNNLPATPSALASTESLLICKYIGSSTPVTFTATAAGTISSYIWTVPTGASFISGATAVSEANPTTGSGAVNSIGLSFAGASTVAGVIGSVTVKSVDANGCASLPKALAIITKVPTAPASLVMTSTDSTDHFNLPAVPATIPATFTFSSLADLAKITKVGPYMGTSTVFTLTAPIVETAASYKWTLPTGLNPIASPTVVNAGSGIATSTTPVITVDFAGVASGIGTIPIIVQSVGGCGLSTNRQLTLARAVPGTPKALVLTNTSQPNLSGLTKITKVGPYTGTSIQFALTATPFLTQGATSTSYAWILPAGVTPTTTYPSITVKQKVVRIPTVENPATSEIQEFAAINSSSNSIDVQFTGTGTGNLDVLVFGVNGAGNSIARKLVLARALPTAPTALVLRDGATVVNRVGPYIGESTSLTLTATPYLTQGAEATSYKWTLPAGVNVTSGATIVSNNGTYTIWTSIGTVLTIDFEGVAPSIFTLPLSVQAVNGAGTSATTRTLTVISAAPSTPGSITTPTLVVPTFNPTCSSGIITVQVPNVYGVDYTWTVGAGATITGGQGTNSITIDVEAVTTTTLAISVIGSNGTGSSGTRALTIKKVATCREASSAIANAFSVIAYPNPSSSEFTIKSSAKGTMSVKVYDMQGRLVEKTNTDKVGSRLAAGAYNVIVNQGANVKTLRVIKK